MRGTSPSKTSTLHDLDKYVNQPQYRGVKPPVRQLCGLLSCSDSLTMLELSLLGACRGWRRY